MDDDILDLGELAMFSNDQRDQVDNDLDELRAMDFDDDIVGGSRYFSEETPDDQFKKEIIADNKQALKFIGDQKLKGALTYLKRCEARVVEQVNIRGETPFLMKLLSITLTNLALYCRKKGIFQVALRYLSKVLEIEKHALDQKITLASTYLNISSILTNLNKHKESYKYCSIANRMYLEIKEATVDNQQSEPGERTGLVSSYLNMATNCEQMGKFKMSLNHANEGYHFGMVELGTRHPLTLNIKVFLDKLSLKLENSKKTETQYSRENGYGSHRIKYDTDHSRSLTVDYRDRKLLSNDKISDHDEYSISGNRDKSFRRGRTTDHGGNHVEDTRLIDINSKYRPKSNVKKSELNNLITNLKVPENINQKYNAQAPRSGSGLGQPYLSQKQPNILRQQRTAKPNRTLPPKKNFTPMFMTDYGPAESQNMMYLPSMPHGYQGAHHPQQHQHPTQVYPIHNQQHYIQHGYNRLPTHHDRSPSNYGDSIARHPSSHQMSTQQVYGEYLPPYYREFQNLRSEDESSMRFQFPKLPKLPEINEISDRKAFGTMDTTTTDQNKSSKLNIDKGFSLSIMPQSRVKVVSQSKKNLSDNNSSTDPNMHNISYAEINASDFIKSPTASPETKLETMPSRPKLKPKVTVFSAEDGSQVPKVTVTKKEPSPVLNMNSLNSIHIDLRPKSTKPLPATHTPTLMSDSLSHHSQDDDGRTKKVHFPTKSQDNRSSTESLSISNGSKYNVSVQYAQKKILDRDDGQRVIQKNPRPEIITKTAEPHKSRKDKKLEEEAKLIKRIYAEEDYRNPATFISDSNKSQTNPYALNEFTNHDKILTESIEIPDNDKYEIEAKQRKDKIDEKYRPKLERIKEEESMTASRFKSLEGSQFGNSVAIKQTRPPSLNNRSKYQVTDVDLPESPIKSTGNKTNFNNSSISDTKSPTDQQAGLKPIMNSPLTTSG